MQQQLPSLSSWQFSFQSLEVLSFQAFQFLVYLLFSTWLIPKQESFRLESIQSPFSEAIAQSV